MEGDNASDTFATGRDEKQAVAVTASSLRLLDEVELRIIALLMIFLAPLAALLVQMAISSTHPPIEERVKRLEKMGSGRP